MQRRRPPPLFVRCVESVQPSGEGNLLQGVCIVSGVIVVMIFCRLKKKKVFPLYLLLCVVALINERAINELRYQSNQ